MMSDSKLLSEQELHDEVLRIIEHKTLDEEAATQLVLNLIQSQKQAHADEVIGEEPKPYINGKYPKRGETVSIDLDANYEESLKFIQENGKAILWAEQRKRNKS